MSTQRVRLTPFGLCICALCACKAPEQRSIPVLPEAIPPRESQFGQSMELGERFVVQKTGPQHGPRSPGGYTHPRVFETAISALISGGGFDWGTSGIGNLRVFDLSAGQISYVFEHDVAIGVWQPWKVTTGTNGMVTDAAALIIFARAEDTDRNRQIDAADEAHLYRYDFATRSRKRLSPSGESVSGMRHLPRKLVFFTVTPGAPTGTTFYVLNPDSDELTRFTDAN